jgi:hypothetical protein
VINVEAKVARTARALLRDPSGRAQAVESARGSDFVTNAQVAVGEASGGHPSEDAADQNDASHNFPSVQPWIRLTPEFSHGPSAQYAHRNPL